MDRMDIERLWQEAANVTTNAKFYADDPEVQAAAEAFKSGHSRPESGVVACRAAGGDRAIREVARSGQGLAGDIRDDGRRR